MSGLRLRGSGSERNTYGSAILKFRIMMLSGNSVPQQQTIKDLVGLSSFFSEPFSTNGNMVFFKKNPTKKDEEVFDYV
jgi:hypothetical protein